MISIKNSVALITSIYLSLLSLDAIALETTSSKLQINGFGSLTLNHGDSDDLGFRDKVSQEGIFDEWDFKQNSRLGLQLNYQVTDNLDFTFQVLAQDRYDNSLNKSVQSAKINYVFAPNYELILGRVPSHVYLLSDYRNAGYAYLWAQVPTEFYGSLSFEYADGAVLRKYLPSDTGQWIFDVFYVAADYRFVQNSQEKFDDELDPTIGFSTEWENDNWRFKFNAVRSKYQSNNNAAETLESALVSAQPFWPGASEHIGEVGIDGSYVNYYSTGFSYNDQSWVVQSEIGLITTDSEFVNDVKSGYLSVGKKFGKFTPYVMGAISKNDKVDVQAYQSNPFLPALINAQIQGLQSILEDEATKSHIDQKTLSFGFRYDVLPKAALKFQWDRTWVEQGAFSLFDIKESPSGDQTLDRFTISLDFIF